MGATTYESALEHDGLLEDPGKWRRYCGGDMPRKARVRDFGVVRLLVDARPVAKRGVVPRVGAAGPVA